MTICRRLRAYCNNTVAVALVRSVGSLVPKSITSTARRAAGTRSGQWSLMKPRWTRTELDTSRPLDSALPRAPLGSPTRADIAAGKAYVADSLRAKSARSAVTSATLPICLYISHKYRIELWPFYWAKRILFSRVDASVSIHAKKTSTGTRIQIDSVMRPRSSSILEDRCRITESICILVPQLQLHFTVTTGVIWYEFVLWWSLEVII